MRSLQPAEAQELVSNGDYVLVDVRPKELFEQSSIEGAVNVPLFQSMDFSKATAQSWLKALAYTFNGVKPVEVNPNFIEEMKTQVAGRNAILVRFTLTHPNTTTRFVFFSSEMVSCCNSGVP